VIGCRGIDVFGPISFIMDGKGNDLMKKPRTVHPLLLALFPTLFLYSHNMVEYSFDVVFVPLVVIVVLTLVLWGLLGVILHNAAKSGLVVSLFLLLFFTYGHVYEMVWYFFAVRPFTFGAENVLLPAFALLLAAGTFLIFRAGRDFSRLTRFANFMSVILLAVTAITIITSYLTAEPAREQDRRAEQREIAARNSVAATQPDIYYIILDAFARADILAEIYNYPNSALYNYLDQRGFYIAHRTGANYCQTMLSLSSTLNYKYLDAATDGFISDSNDRRPLKRMVYNNRAMKFLREHGYTIMAFASGSAPTEFRNADVFIEPVGKLWFLDEFQSGLLNTTPLPHLVPRMDRIPFMGEEFSHPQADARREMVRRTYDLLPKIPQRKSPKFVFVHVVMPHPPFLFGPNGEERNPRGVFHLADGNALIGRYIRNREDYIGLYRNQLMFIEKKTIAALEGILANSAQPPIIVLQSDHGPGAYLNWENSDSTNMRERLGILNAYYLPGSGDTLLWETITPVNTFRVIFNHYFDANLEILKDENYFSLWSKPYWFMPVGQAVKQDRPSAPQR